MLQSLKEVRRTFKNCSFRTLSRQKIEPAWATAKAKFNFLWKKFYMEKTKTNHTFSRTFCFIKIS